MKSNPENIRSYQAGDETGILDLRGQVLSSGRNLKHWNWQFKDHPHGPGWITIAESGESIVGQHALMCADLNYTGRRLSGGQSCDTMIRDDFRGQGLYKKIAEINYEKAAAEGCQAIFSFPNRNSFPGLVRNHDWCKITELKYHYFRLGVANLCGRGVDRILRLPRMLLSRLKLTLLKRLQRGVEITASSRLRDTLAPMLLEILDHEILSIWKDLDYLRWRYENHPEHDYRFHTLAVAGKPEALVITRDRGDAIAICDILHRTGNIPQTAILVQQIITEAFSSRAQRIEFYGHDGGFFEAVSNRCGMRVVPTSALTFGGRIFVQGKITPLFVLPQNWTVAYGDSDIV
ncbi:MAG: GNAT family N-acetyltransferase [bacterium]|nr:GNAT family N-acetyltransferase [bacterium]